MIRSILLFAVATAVLAADRFDVVSIQPNTDANSQLRTMRLPGGRFQAVAAPLAVLVRLAYGIHDLQLVGAQGWTTSERFDITATVEGAPEKVPEDVTQRRLQTLLAERFLLKVRKESKEMPVFALVVPKNGTKLKPMTEPSGPAGPRGEGMGILRTTTIKGLCSALTTAAGRIVLDETGLTGSYDMILEFPIERTQGAPPPSLASFGSGLLAAAQEQLGLKLESKRAPVEFVVIESAERPTGN
jgi:uncharacterized protein (TIGR03435 family)